MSNQLEAAIIKRHDLILILDFGSQYTHIIARRIRELGVYCEVHACNVSADFIKSFQATGKLKGIILSGSPYSVYEEGSPHANPVVWDLGVPILGICYGAQEIALQFGGAVEAGAKREYGHAKLDIVKTESGASALFHALPDEIDVWMSHGDKVTALPEGFVDIGVTSNSEHAAFYSAERNIYAIQFHAEVFHTPLGKDIFNNFVDTICGCKKDWSMGSFLEESIEAIRAQVGPNGIVIGAVSGGVDSTVAAVLMNRALGDRFHAYFIDNGVLRLNEQEEVKKRLIEKEGINLTVVDASDLFLSKLEGVTDPEKKRKIIGNTFIEVFQEEALKLEAKTGHIEFLLQGTLYPDVIESVSFKGPSATIKTHHNVGGLLENMRLKLVEPLRELFKDEVRQLGRVLGIGEESIMRHPFPGPGLAIRVLGAITREQLDILKQADAIYLEEIKKAGIYNEIAQAFAVILPVRTVGVMGDARTYAQVIALRAVQSTDFMTADWYPMPYDLLKRISSRIINEVKGVNRVVYDVSSKPPSTIEWE